MPPDPAMNAMKKLPGAPPMPGQGLQGIGNAIQRLPGFGGGTGVSSGQQGQMPWQSTGKPMDQELEAQRLLSGQPAAPPQMPGGGGMFGAGGGGANAINEWMLNNARQSAPQGGGGGGMFGVGGMQKPGMQNMMAQMLGSAPAVPLGPQQANMAAGGGAAAMGEPTSYAKSGGGGGGQAKAAQNAIMAARRGR